MNNMDMQSPEIIEQLAKIDRDMDSGKVAFVVNAGERFAFDRDLLTEYGIESGQTVSGHIIVVLMRANLARIRALCAIEKARKAGSP